MNVLVHKEEKVSYPYIIDPNNFNRISPAEIFGKDGKLLLEACNRVFNNWLPTGKYEGCYFSHSRPTMSDVREIVEKSKKSFGTAYREAITAWKFANPEEVIKEYLSRKEWEENRDKQFRIIYGIAKRHGLYLQWHGASCGDKWTIYKKRRSIARICCV